MTTDSNESQSMLERPTDPLHYAPFVELNARSATAPILAWAKCGFFSGLYGNLLHARLPAMNLPSHQVMRYAYSAMTVNFPDNDKEEFKARMAYVDVMISRMFQLERKAMSVKHWLTLLGLLLQLLLFTTLMTAIFVSIRNGSEAAGIIITIVGPTVYWLSSKYFGRLITKKVESLLLPAEPEKFIPWIAESAPEKS